MGVSGKVLILKICVIKRSGVDKKAVELEKLR